MSNKVLDIYENINEIYPTIIACDVSSGSREDYSNMTIIDPKTKRVIDVFTRYVLIIKK